MIGRPTARLLGIPVVIDPSWTIIAVLVWWILFATLAGMDNQTSLPAELAIAGAGTIVFFASLLAHELSHSVVARRRGVGVRRIRLFLFGGVSEIEREAATPADELAITAAGPAASLGLGGLFFLVALAVPARAGALDQAIELLAALNVALAVFNLAPGFPLDGGRVVRALIWRATGDYGRATRIAVAGGRVVAGLLGLGGAALLGLARDVAGVWWLAVAAFLWVAAGRAGLQLRIDERLAGRTVADLMRPSGPGVRPAEPLDRVAAEAGQIVPVVAGGRVRGMLDVRRLRALPPAARAGWGAADAMQPVGPSAVIAAAAPAVEALPRLADGVILVVVADGRMVGWLDRESVDSWLRRG